MSFHRKVAVSTMVLMPKLLIGICFIYIGIFFLGTSRSNTDLLLNSLACSFVLDIDELIFKNFTPQPLQDLIQDIPPFEHMPGSASIWHTMSGEIKLGATIGLTVLCFCLVPRCEIWDDSWDEPFWYLLRYLQWSRTINTQPDVLGSPDWCNLHPDECNMD